MCGACVLVELSLSFLTLPEILWTIKQNAASLIGLVVLATLIAGLLCAIAILVDKNWVGHSAI